MNVEKLVIAATNGDKNALEGVILAIQDNIYNLSLRMLVNPEDARDATQEILIKVITNLSSFKFESQLNTWVYRISVNYLITEKKILSKDIGLTFDLYKQDLESDLQAPLEPYDTSEYQVLLNELRISCTMAMLLCLKPSHRMAYILGDILEMDHVEASNALSITKDSFRKQLSRARAKVVEFTSANCGLIATNARCSCEYKLQGAINRKRVSPERIYFSNKEQHSYAEIKSAIKETQKDLKTLKFQKSISPYKCPIELGDVINLLAEKGM